MIELHCAHCGGFVTELRHVSYRPVSDGAVAAALTRELCACAPPIVFGPPPGYMSSPGLPIPARPSV
jgi:hypothetical protein